MRRLRCSFLLLVALATALPAQEKNRHEHSGFWLAIGFGAANTSIDCVGCAFRDVDDPWHGGSGAGAVYAAGWTVNQQLLLGVALGGTGRTRGTGRDMEAGSIFLPQLTAQYYPWPASGFHLRGGVGPALYVLERLGGSVHARGYGLLAEAGRDWRFRGSFALTPYISLAAIAVRPSTIEVQGDGGGVTDMKNSMVVHAGVSLRYY